MLQFGSCQQCVPILVREIMLLGRFEPISQSLTLPVSCTSYHLPSSTHNQVHCVLLTFSSHQPSQHSAWNIRSFRLIAILQLV
ncbi:unnamed protein product [Schistosoma curassoni]|nr:unnamed protein product [Schistosoma curassoni]